MSATIKGIANKLGISVSTVSKALNNASDVSEHTRSLVINEALAQGYNMKNLKTDKGKKLCIFIENMDYQNIEQFGYEVILGFQTQAMESGYEVDILPLNLNIKSKHKYDQYMMENNYSGGFMLGLQFHDDFMQQLCNTTYPTVLLDNYIDNEKIAWVGTDSSEGIRKAVQLLVEHKHKKIAFLSGGRNSMVSQEKLYSYRSAIVNYGIIPDEGLIVYGNYTERCGENCVMDILKKGATALICASDLMAVGALKELHRLGKKLPEEFSLIGYDDLPFTIHTFPPLTTIRQDRKDIGKNALFVLEQLIHGSMINKLLLKPQLILRDSVGFCNENL